MSKVNTWDQLCHFYKDSNLFYPCTECNQVNHAAGIGCGERGRDRHTKLRFIKCFKTPIKTAEHLRGTQVWPPPHYPTPIMWGQFAHYDTPTRQTKFSARYFLDLNLGFPKNLIPSQGTTYLPIAAWSEFLIAVCCFPIHYLRGNNFSLD